MVLKVVYENRVGKSALIDTERFPPGVREKKQEADRPMYVAMPFL